MLEAVAPINLPSYYSEGSFLVKLRSNKGMIINLLFETENLFLFLDPSIKLAYIILISPSFHDLYGHGYSYSRRAVRTTFFWDFCLKEPIHVFLCRDNESSKILMSENSSSMFLYITYFLHVRTFHSHLINSTYESPLLPTTNVEYRLGWSRRVSTLTCI